MSSKTTATQMFESMEVSDVIEAQIVFFIIIFIKISQFFCNDAISMDSMSAFRPIIFSGNTKN
jgi:hypothetical protein